MAKFENYKKIPKLLPNTLTQVINTYYKKINLNIHCFLIKEIQNTVIITKIHEYFIIGAKKQAKEEAKKIRF